MRAMRAPASVRRTPAALATNKEGHVTATPVIAIVDDDVSVRQALGSLLRSFNLAVELYASGPDLLRSPGLDAIRCLVTDVQMPAMSGFALHAELRARGLDIPAVFMTAFPEARYRERAKELDGCGFLSKPFLDIDMIRCVEQALARQRGAGRAG